MNKVIRKKKLLIDALEKSLGVITPACKEVGISRNQFYIYYRNDPEFKAAVDALNDLTLDFAEAKLLQKMKEGNERSIIFFLKSKGKSRGYGDNIEINGNINHDIRVIRLNGPREDELLEDDDDEEKND